MKKILTAEEWFYKKHKIDMSDVVCYESKTDDSESIYLEEELEEYANYKAKALIESLTDEEIYKLTENYFSDNPHIKTAIDYRFGIIKARRHYLNKLKKEQ